MAVRPAEMKQKSTCRHCGNPIHTTYWHPAPLWSHGPLWQNNMPACPSPTSAEPIEEK